MDPACPQLENRTEGLKAVSEDSDNITPTTTAVSDTELITSFGSNKSPIKSELMGTGTGTGTDGTESPESSLNHNHDHIQVNSVEIMDNLCTVNSEKVPEEDETVVSGSLMPIIETHRILL